MKKSLSGIAATLLLLVTLSFTFSEDKDMSLCRAQRISGKLVFMNAEPVQDYEVVSQVKVFYMGSPESPLEIAEPVVKKALKESKDFDAIILSPGKQHSVIRFKKS